MDEPLAASVGRAQKDAILRRGHPSGYFSAFIGPLVRFCRSGDLTADVVFDDPKRSAVPLPDLRKGVALQMGRARFKLAH